MWSIGIYVGESPFHLRSPPNNNNPVLTAQNVSDVPAEFVADPFMLRSADVWYMFFEVMNGQTKKGEIGLATSDNGLDWKYRQIVLAEPFHLSYPYTFEWNNAFYMIPETLQAEAVCLYKADDFPTRWSRVGSLINGAYADPSIFRFDDKWWLFACSAPYQHDVLRLYFAEDLMGLWTEHPESPIVEGDLQNARPGGRPLELNNKIIRFAQDCIPIYGSRVRAFEIFELTTGIYLEKENKHSPVLAASGNGWNGLGMHHIDPHQIAEGNWIACVDGFSGRSD